ncbi:MAG: NAD(P)-dependent oxidoreductase [Pseudomonadota bacterium]
MTEEIAVRLAVPYPDKLSSYMQDQGLAFYPEPIPDSVSARCAMITFKPQIEESLSRYEWVHVGGAGIDAVRRMLLGANVNPILTRTIGAMGKQIAEYCLSYILADLQKHDFRAAQQQRKSWDMGAAEGKMLFETDVAILGVGGTASDIAQCLKPLCRSVIGYGRSARPRDGFHEVRKLSEFVGSPIVINALPATPETDRIAGSDFFRHLDQALFINIGRGATVDDKALLEALDRGYVRQAVLDVFHKEPLPEDHPFWSHDKIAVSPHTSGITRPADIAAAFLRHLPDFRNGTLTSTVDLMQGY